MANNEIHYRDTGSGGPLIVLVHGNSQSSDGFIPVLASPLGSQYRIIAPDLPGHGDSPPSPSPQETYTLSGYASVLIELADKLDLAGAIWVGNSLGGHILFNAWSDLPNPAGLLVYGTPPLEDPPAMDIAFNPVPGIQHFFSPERSNKIAEEVAAALSVEGKDFSTQIIRDFLRTDPIARQRIGEILASGIGTDESEVVKNLGKSIAILHGEFDRCINLEYFDRLTIPQLWRGAVQIISGGGHLSHMDAPAEFCELLGAFADEVFTSTAIIES